MTPGFLLISTVILLLTASLLSLPPVPRGPWTK